MLHILNLFLPAFIPSWRFFDIIAPSPRIEYTFLSSTDDVPQQWHQFRPRPKTLSFFLMIKRLFFNAYWNETLFLMSCAERLMQSADQHSENEIFIRLMSALDSKKPPQAYIQFRLIFISCEEGSLQKHTAFISSIREITKRENHGI